MHFLSKLFLLLSFSAYNCFAHPVIWKDGIANTATFTANRSEIRSHYSLSSQWSLGLHQLRVNKENYLMAQSNWLAKRWNKRGSQANIYLFSGFGASIHQSKQENIGHIGFQADWETRNLYTQLSTQTFLKSQSFHFINARIGFAPYIANYNFLHTWLIFQVEDFIIANKHHLTAMPVIRFFKDTYLFEIGSNFSGRYLITAMIHF